MLRVLVGAAAVAVLGYIGYFFYGEWTRHSEAQRIAASAMSVRSSECKALVGDLTAVRQGKDLGRRFVQADAVAAIRQCLADKLLAIGDLGELDL